MTAPSPVDTAVAGPPRSPARRLRRIVADAVTAGLARAAGRAVLRTAPGRGAWRAAVAAPGIPDRARIGLARRVQDGMLRAGHPSSAARVATVVARTVGATAAAHTEGATATARTGGDRLVGAAAAMLAVADGYHRRHEAATAAAAVENAGGLLFSWAVHLDELTSALAADPEGFLAPLHRSAVGRALAAPRGRAAAAAAPPPGRPARLLVVTGGNDNFLGPLRQRYAALPGWDVRFLDLGADPARAPLLRGRAGLIEDVLAGGTEYGRRVSEWLAAHLGWADTVFVDWCTAAAALVTLVDPGRTRVVVRLHSYEALGLWPHLVDFSRVDDLVFVSEHLRDLARAVVPRLRQAGAPRTHVVCNAVDLGRCRGEKPAGARFHLGLVGIRGVVKDPRWAVEVLRILRRHDDRYRLLLIGEAARPTSEAARRYQRLLERDLAELEPNGAVRRLGHRDDVPAALTEVGVILSSSVRESFHCGLVEGAASGAVPVVRDWPFFAGRRHGARTLFPTDWVVDTPEQAAERILALTASDARWRAAGAAAATHALATWDWSVVHREFDRVLLGEALPEVSRTLG